VHCANSHLLVLYIHGEKSPPNFYPNPTLELLFAKKRARKLFQKRFLTRRLSVIHQKQNRCASDRPWQRSFWPNTTTNQQYRGTSLSMKIIASSLCNFILVDCCIVASFLDLVKNTSPWPCWPWQLRFRDGITSNPTDTCPINQVEYKLNSDVTRFFYLFFSHRNSSAKRHGRSRRRSTGGEFVVRRRLQYLPHMVEQNCL
jgi:hypothetical protein